MTHGLARDAGRADRTRLRAQESRPAGISLMKTRPQPAGAHGLAAPLYYNQSTLHRYYLCPATKKHNFRTDGDDYCNLHSAPATCYIEQLYAANGAAGFIKFSACV